MDWKQLLASITSSVDEELRLRNAYLLAENRILRRQITGRLLFTDHDRQALAAIGQQLGRRALAEIATVATSETILAWHRTCAPQTCDGAKPRKSLGRPRIDQEIEDVVVRMARENRSWGYDRLVGALANLDYTISDQTVGEYPEAPWDSTGSRAQEDHHVAGVRPYAHGYASRDRLFHRRDVDLVWFDDLCGPLLPPLRESQGPGRRYDCLLQGVVADVAYQRGAMDRLRCSPRAGRAVAEVPPSPTAESRSGCPP